MAAKDDQYWRSATEDESMEDRHGFLWEATLRTIGRSLNNKRVLDAGCNRGGFLRLLHDEWGIAEGFGYDPASGAIDDAQRLSQGRRLHFEVADTVPDEWNALDIAFSHGVIYLLHDLPAHASAMERALISGGDYYAGVGAHADSPLLVKWHQEHADELNLPRLYSVDEIVDVFDKAGFDCNVARMQLGFVPAAGLTAKLMEWLEYYYEHKLLFRFTKP